MHEVTAFYSSDLIRQWKENMRLDSFEHPHWRWYESNWRILHIDGFEPGYGSRTIRFDWGFGFSIPEGAKVTGLSVKFGENNGENTVLEK